MKARSFSHVGITVSDFNRAVQFYWEVFGCPLVGVADTPPERVRSFFGVDAPAPSCKIGWIRVPGGGVLEIFAFEPKQPADVDPVEPRRPDALLVQRAQPAALARLPASKGVEIVSTPERSPRGHSFFFVRDFDGNLIELMDLGYMYYVLGWLGPLGGWLFRRGMYKRYYAAGQPLAADRTGLTPTWPAARYRTASPGPRPEPRQSSRDARHAGAVTQPSRPGHDGAARGHRRAPVARVPRARRQLLLRRVGYRFGGTRGGPRTSCARDLRRLGRERVLGDRLASVCERAGGTVRRVAGEWGRAIDPAELRDALRSSGADVVSLVHAETSTGVRNPVEELCAVARAAGAATIVDTVTSLGGVPVDVAAWQADGVYSCTQKGLGAPSGLAPVCFSARAIETARRAPCRSFYFDLGLLQEYWTARRSTTPSRPR